MALGRTTKLQAINIALLDAQLSPVESLNSGDPDAEAIEITLEEVHVEVLTTGWHWNTLVLELSPDTNGNIILGEDTLKIDAVDRGLDVSLISNKLFDKSRNSYIFNEKVKLKLTIIREWDELPQTARRYIAKKTSRLFQQRTTMDPALNDAIIREEQVAWGQMQKDDISMKDFNIIKSGYNSMRATNRRGVIY